MAAHIGCRAKLTGLDGIQYIGFIHSVDTNIGKLTLQKVTCVASAGGEEADEPTSRKLQGLLHFHGKEIKDLVVFSDNPSKSSPSLVSQRSREDGPTLSRCKSIPAHLRGRKMMSDEHLVLGRDESGGTGTINRNDSHSLKSSDYDSSSDLGEGANYGDFNVIDKIDSVFQEAIAFIRRQSIIGLGLEGINLGREGELCWLQISTKEEIFLFDILTLRKEAFENGLQDILESGNIQKVIHDCRQPSDMLYHQYDVQLVNVFDTQVADAFIYRMTHDGDYPRYVTGLHGILLSLECCDLKEITIVRYREKYLKEDQKIWARRPAPEHILMVASKQVKHLLSLRVRQMEALLRMVNVGTDIYLGYVRDASAEDAKRGPSTNHLLPSAFQHMNTYMDFHRHSYRTPSRRRQTHMKDERGFQENCDGVIDPCIIGSVGSIFQAGTNYNSPVYRRRSDGDSLRQPRGPHYRPVTSLPNSPAENTPTRSSPIKHGHCVSRGPTEARRPAVSREREGHCSSSTSSHSGTLESVRERPDIIVSHLRGDGANLQNLSSEEMSPKAGPNHKMSAVSSASRTFTEKVENQSPESEIGKSYFSDKVDFRPAGSLINDLGKRRRRYRTDDSDMEGSIKLGDYSCPEESDNGESFSCIPSRETLGRFTSRETTSLKETIEAAKCSVNNSPEQLRPSYNHELSNGFSDSVLPHEVKYDNVTARIPTKQSLSVPPGNCESDSESLSSTSNLVVKRSPYAGLGRGILRFTVVSPPGSGYSSDDSRRSMPSPQKLLNSFVSDQRPKPSNPESPPQYSTDSNHLASHPTRNDSLSNVTHPQTKSLVNSSSSVQTGSLARKEALLKLLSKSSNSSSLDSSSESGFADQSQSQRKHLSSQQY